MPTNSIEQKLAERDFIDLKTDLLASLLIFIQTMYKIRTGREFEVSKPICRESHHISICKSLFKVFTGETTRLIINVPPRYSKTEILINFVAWTLAHFPDSNYLYVSYSHSLAKLQTQTIRQIITLGAYRKLFDVMISPVSSAKDDFQTTRGGSVYAAGSGGTITGRGAGIKNCDRFGGAVLIDDIHKPDEVSSDTMRNSVIDWYYNTMQSRLNNGVKTPIVFIGQRLHEADLPARLIETGEWETLIIPALDEPKNALWPTMHTKEDLFKMQEVEPYVFASQMQQNPQPAGGGIFKKEWFLTLEYAPEILATFITCDTGETEKTYNDPTALSFWGIYKIKKDEIDLDLYGLHWIDCIQEWVEPKDLKALVLDFYAACMRFEVKPKFIAIEKKSTGTTLSSILGEIQGLDVININRTRASGSKTERYLEIQPIIGSKRVTLPLNAKHTKMCIEHCGKITANNSHRYDDICDNLYDGVKMALIDETLINLGINKSIEHKDNAVKKLADVQRRRLQLRRERIW